MRVAIFGGTGFVGSYLIDALIASGHQPSVLVRSGSESKVRQAKRCRLVTGDLSSKTAIDGALEGCDAVIYTVGILQEFPKRGITFEELQYRGAVRVVEAATNCGIRRLLLMSANGVKVPGTPYQESKFRAEEYAKASGLDVTIFRPSVLQRIAQAAGRNKWILPMPIGLMKIAATLFGWLPFFPVTRDQLTMLAEGNIGDPSELTTLIGREPRAFVPANLAYLRD